MPGFLNPYILIGLLVAFLGTGFGGYTFGVHHEQGIAALAQQKVEKQLRDEQDARRTEVQKVRADADKQIADLELSLLRARENIRTVTRTITKEVPVYVTVEADARCVVPVGFVSLWNRSTSDPAGAGDSTAAPEAGIVLDAPSGVALSAVAEAATENHAAYWAVVNEVKARDKYIDALLDYIHHITEINK